MKYIEGYPVGPIPNIPSEIKPGEGINIIPENQSEILSFTGPVGSGTAAYYKISIWLSRQGFERFKVNEWIYVSPANKPYYDLTIGQREELQIKIKQHLASIAAAISDLELAEHDLRKYREYMDYFEKIEKGKKLLKEKGKEDEGKKLILEGNQTLRSIFIDMVDVYTGEGVSMRSIAPRWPTIISDFMKLDDEDVMPDQIAKKLEVSEAEAVILSTKNKLFLEWRDKLFKPTVKSRYENILKLVESRRASLIEYKEMVKPIIAKYKMINDALTSPKLRSVIKKSFFRPDAQTFSLDFMELWAWKPWAASEKYKAPAETPLSKIPAKVAGFSKKEIEYIKKMDKNWDGKVPALPVKLIVDRVLRVIIKNIEKKYNVTITPVDVLNAIKTLSGMYEGHSSGSTGEIWSFSPYFFFYQIPIQRLMLKLPNGAELEDIEINPLQMYVKTQNVILGHILELEARSKVLEREIGVLLGEFGYDKESKKWIDIQKLLTKNYPNIYESEQTEEMSMQRYEELKPNEVKREKFLSKLRRFGWSFALFVAKGPYEHAFLDRFTKFYFTPSGEQLGRLIAYLFSLYGVPV